MNKGLEEAIKIFNELEIQDDTEFKEARKTILNHINNSIPKDKIREKIEEIQKYKDIAGEQIEESIVIADSDSLNFGRKQAHGKDVEVLKELLEGK